MRVVPFEPAHIARMQLQPRQRSVSIVTVTPTYLDLLQRAGPAYTAEADDGRVLASGGIALTPFGMGTLWVYASERLIPHAVRLDRVLRRVIELQPLRRLEATTAADWVESCRWLEDLGFVSEGILRRYDESGADHIRYART